MFEIKYTYTTPDGCSGEASGTIYVCPSGFGVDEDQGLGVEVYPNPASDKLIIESDDAIGTLEIHNLMGVLLYSKKDCDSKVEIDVSWLPSGVYFVRGAFNIKFVKQ